MKLYKKAVLFKMFDEGRDIRDEKVKAIGYKANTLRSYYNDWKKQTGKFITTDRESIAGVSVGSGEIVTKEPYPDREHIGEVRGEDNKDDIKDEEHDNLDEFGEELSPKASIEDESNGHKDDVDVVITTKKEAGIPENIVGLGLPITTKISVKTLALYQIASSTSEDKLSLGDFIDQCVDDFFEGRGMSLGLINNKGG